MCVCRFEMSRSLDLTGLPFPFPFPFPPPNRTGFDKAATFFLFFLSPLPRDRIGSDRIG